MAVFRNPPRCTFCNKALAIETHRDQSHLPPLQQVYGDTFEGWEYIDHECEGSKKFEDSFKEIKDRTTKF